MKMKFNESKTKVNVTNSYLGELNGKALYMIFAEQARKENLEDVAVTLEKLAYEEEGHAKVLGKFLEEEVEVNINFDQLRAVSTTTKANLLMASAGEMKAYKEVYPAFSKLALEEGFEDIAKTYDSLKKIELIHSNKLRDLAENL